MYGNDGFRLAQTLNRRCPDRLMFTMTPIVQGNSSSRKVLVLRIWQHSGQPPIWIAEIQDVSTGEVIHASGLEALFDILRQLFPPNPQSTSLEKNHD